MRTFFALVVAVTLVGAPAVAGAAMAAPATLELEQQTPPQPPDLRVDVDADEGGAWYTSPLWIAIGVIAVVLIIALAVMAGRGGGTTVVRG